MADAHPGVGCCLPDTEVKQDLDAFLPRVRGVRSCHLQAAATDLLGSEAGLEKVGAEVVDQRLLIKRNQHRRRICLPKRDRGYQPRRET